MYTKKMLGKKIQRKRREGAMLKDFLGKRWGSAFLSNLLFPSTFLWIVKLLPFYFLVINLLGTKHSIKEHVISFLENMVF